MLEGVRGRTAEHICFGYAAVFHARPNGYSFLPELCGCSAHQISIETAQSNLDFAELDSLSNKENMLGELDLSTNEIEHPDVVAARIRRALPHVSPEYLIIARDCGLKYLPRNVPSAR